MLPGSCRVTDPLLPCPCLPACSWVKLLEQEGVIEKFVPIDFTEAETVFERCLKVCSSAAGGTGGGGTGGGGVRVTLWVEHAAPACLAPLMVQGLLQAQFGNTALCVPATSARMCGAPARVLRSGTPLLTPPLPLLPPPPGSPGGVVHVGQHRRRDHLL